MVFWWIGNLLLVVAIFPVVVLLLKGVLDAARSIPPKIETIASVGAAASKDLDAVPLLLTTQKHTQLTIDTVANYGGSLDIVLEDA